MALKVKVAQWCPTFCDPKDYTRPGLPIHHQILDLAQIHVHRVGDTRLSNQGILQVALMVKNLPTNAGDIDEGLLLGLGRPAGRGHGSPLQYSCLEKPHGQRSLVG